MSLFLNRFQGKFLVSFNKDIVFKLFSYNYSILKENSENSYEKCQSKIKIFLMALNRTFYEFYVRFNQNFLKNYSGLFIFVRLPLPLPFRDSSFTHCCFCQTHYKPGVNKHEKASLCVTNCHA